MELWLVTVDEWWQTFLTLPQAHEQHYNQHRTHRSLAVAT
ncbi:hypothetical protein SAMN05421507_12658 [Lentzea jiangxiensis]|uniref:Uncharacterized protein n=1 Tax=Lentzea jiangxiensis TaxID=641025 RepID=A0A1H0WZ53_9PSEU|nr:hypothetical protein SAMN05421507_12658 [Lentzea jiangxiensis]